MASILLTITALAGVPASAQINTDQVVNVGRNAMYFSDYVLAIQYFNRAIAQKPYLAWPYFWRSVAKINLEDYEGALADASKTIELNPFITDAYEVRGVARQNLGDNRGAIEDYRLALEQIPDNRQLTYNMACALVDEKEYEKADSVFTRLLDRNPGFENGWLGRGRLRILQKDTLDAARNITHAIEINPNSFNGHAMMADIELRRGKERYDSALYHLDRAIKLQPEIAGLYVNRAYIRYLQNDWYGAMDDFDNALQLDPANHQARFNRALLEMEVSDYDHALSDFSDLLKENPNDIRSRYNRAVIYLNRHNLDKGLADLLHVARAFPEYPTIHAQISEIYRQKGNTRQAKVYYDKAIAAADAFKRNRRRNKDAARRAVNPFGTLNDDGDTESAPELSPEEAVKQEFATLLISDDNTDFRQEFNNSEIRGRVQDRNLSIGIEPMVELTFYISPNQVRNTTYYIKEVDDLNATRALRNKVLVSPSVASLTDEDLIARHFKNIEYYNSYLAMHTPRTVDYVGRAMDLITVRNYEDALKDLDRAIALSPDYAPAYMLRAQARNHALDLPAQPEATEASSVGTAKPVKPIHSAQTHDALRQRNIDLVVADLDRVIALSPRNPFALYNKANILIRRGDLDEALALLDRALELKPDFGEAYFNRGYVHLRQGNRQQGIADLSKAGEMGIVAAYNLIKRISK
ncbi:MAG: tetratricopeptide repeat protein [Muribaculaceae bacterium]|nr:tetratricopeptide repeat protein [Muribaculaceae bacterium]